MPQIKMRGVDTAKVCEFSQTMLDQLSQIIHCPREDLTIEVIPSTFILDGQVTSGYPFVEIAWFDRGQEIQDQVAQKITHLLQQAGYPCIDLFFTRYERNCYYENGKHF